MIVSGFRFREMTHGEFLDLAQYGNQGLAFLGELVQHRLFVEGRLGTLQEAGFRHAPQSIDEGRSVGVDEGASKVREAKGGLGEETDDPQRRIVAEQLQRVGRAVSDDSILRPHTTIILVFSKKY